MKDMRTLMEGFKKGLNEAEEKIHVRLLDNVDEFGADDWGMSEDSYQELLDHVGQEAIATWATGGDENIWEQSYFDLSFPDGYETYGVSYYHLEKLDDEEYHPTEEDVMMDMS